MPYYPATAVDPLNWEGVPWRTLVTDLNGAILSFLDNRANERVVDLVLNGPAQARGNAASFDFEVSGLHTDGSPFVSFSNRLLFMLRREDSVNDSGERVLWFPRFAGIMMPVERQGTADNAYSSWTAYDPWQLLYQRPAIDENNILIADKWTIPVGARPNDVIKGLLDRMLDPFTIVGSPNQIITPEFDYANAFLDWTGVGHPYYTGTWEECDPLEHKKTFDVDTTVGEVLDYFTDNNLCDIEMEPIWDPLNRPGVCCQVNVYDTKGLNRNNAVLGWDMMGRNLAGLSVLHDAQIANRIRWRTGSNTGPTIAVQSDEESYERYGDYWQIAPVSAERLSLELEVLAGVERVKRRHGNVTYSIDPLNARSPLPLIEYGLGDYLPLWASERLGEAISPEPQSGDEWILLQRIYGITIEIGDNFFEKVTLNTQPPEAA